MNFKILNSEHWILSIPKEDIPDVLHGHTLVFYWPKRDAIVLSESSSIFKDVSEIVEGYLSLDDYDRKEVMDSVPDGRAGEFILGIVRVLNRIIRIRRRLYRSMLRKARAAI